MKKIKTILTKIVHILIVIFTGNTTAFFTETVTEESTISGEIVAPKDLDGLNQSHQRVFGRVRDTILRGDAKHFSPPHLAQQDIFIGGYANNITIENQGNQDIFGGNVENTVIKDEGRATLKNHGIFKDGKIYKGGVFNAQSGTVENIKVYNNGQFDISGNDDGVIVEGGEITHGAKGIFMGKARINNLKINGDVSVPSQKRDNPHFSHAYIGKSGKLLLSAGTIKESTIEGGLLSVTHSEANNTTMKGGIKVGEGDLLVGEGGVSKRTYMTGGSMHIKDGGLAEETVVNGGGRIFNENGTDIDTIVNSGTYTLGDAHSMIAQSNHLTLNNEGTAYIRKGTVNGANIGNGQLILGFGHLEATLKGDVIIGEHGQLNIINNGDLNTREVNLNISGRINLDNDLDPGKISRFRKVSMNNGCIYFNYSISDGFQKNHSILFLESLNGKGTFWMHTDIAEHKGDLLQIRGEAHGHFSVMVTDSGKSPKPEDKLKIIQTGGGDANFTLGNPGHVVDVGTYQYHLVPDHHKRGWSLISRPPQPSEKPQPGSEAPVPPSVTETVSASKLISETKSHTLKPEVPVTPSVKKEGEKKVAPYQLLSPTTNVSRTNHVPDIPSITPSTAAVLSISTVDPLIYHSEMAQIQERMSSTSQAKTESAVWIKIMNERHNILQKEGEGYGLKLNGMSIGSDRTMRMGHSAYTTQGLFFTYSDAKLNFRGKALGDGKVSSWSAGAYSAYCHDSGFWLDGILKANRFSQEIHGRMTGGGDAFGDFSTLALGASIQGGKDMVAREITFTPYLSIGGLRTTRSGLLLSNGMKGDISAQRSVLGKVGLRAVYQTRVKDISVTPWIDIGSEREFIKKTRVWINHHDAFENDLSGITGVYSFGLSSNMSETFNVSASAGYKQGKHIKSPWSSSLGMSWKF
ncbi:autotransporter outer membrane beta-barrel domain-containing protein [Candidatus Williamhamiltonella defendens]|uniref:autotransporter outer membrane beta-barrel domain-containing protein n=1 Tax=Candidatus Williamhamiltonella defendens TaxID=138072 RepID=UPI00130E0D8E|nr:autotransporter outer membrane beta-barrel domain-containing protein [Candidatus Hamiltonella defensa]